MINEPNSCPFCGSGGESMYELYCVPLGDELAIGELKREPKAVIILCDSEAIRYVKERTCQNTEYLDGCFACSACGKELEDPRQEPNFVKWCPFCGARVVEELLT